MRVEQGHTLCDGTVQPGANRAARLRMAPHFVYFDLETERLSHEVGGWSHIEKLGLAVAVTLSSRDEQFRAYRANEATQLVAELQACDCVVGFNLRGFDFRVLQPYADIVLRDLPNLDLMLDVKAQSGFRAGLDNLCAATLDASKSSEGTKAVEWWRAGRQDEVIAYCQQDVRLTRDLHVFGAQHGHVKLLDKRGQTRQIAVPWRLDALRTPAAAIALKIEQPSLFD